MSEGLQLEKLTVVIALDDQFTEPIKKAVENGIDQGNKLGTELVSVAKQVEQAWTQVTVAIEGSTQAMQKSRAHLQGVARDAQLAAQAIASIPKMPTMSAPSLPTAAPVSVPSAAAPAALSAPASSVSTPAARAPSAPASSGGARSASPAAPAAPAARRAPGLGSLAAEFAATKAMIDSLERASAPAAKAASSLSKVGSAAASAAPFIGMFSGEAGAAVGAVSILGETLVPVAAGAGVFSAAVYGTTYALRGAEAANNSMSDTLEGLKIIVDSVGWTQYSEGAKAAAAAEGDLKRQQQSAAEVMGATIAKRQDMIATLNQQVQAMHGVTEAQQAEFVNQYVGALGQLGVQGKDLDRERQRANDAVDFRQINEAVSALEKEAQTYGKTKEQILDMILAENRASQITYNRVAAARAKIKAIDDAAARDKAAKKEAEAAAAAEKKQVAEAQRHAEAIKREGERVTESVKTQSQKQADELNRLQELYAQKAISKETLIAARTNVLNPAAKASKESGFDGAKSYAAELQSKAQSVGDANFVSSGLGSIVYANQMASEATPAPMKGRAGKQYWDNVAARDAESLSSGPEAMRGADATPAGGKTEQLEQKLTELIAALATNTEATKSSETVELEAAGF